MHVNSLENQSLEYQLLYETNLKLSDLYDMLEVLLNCVNNDEYLGLLGVIQLNISAILEPIQKHVYK